MICLLPSARPQERVKSIKHLPENTFLVLTPREEKIDIPYPYIISEAEGYWKAMNEAISHLGWRYPFVWLADDIKPQKGWYEEAQSFYHENCPDRLGLVALNDVNVRQGGAAFAVLTKEWLYVLFGEPKFPEDFGHNFLDTVIADRSKDLGRYYYCPDSVVEHLHPAVGKADVDEVYEANKARARKWQDKQIKDRYDREWRDGERKEARQRYKNARNRIAYFVLGPEGSGTHMMRNALVESGCHWEQWFEEVDEDKLDFHDMPAPIVVRRSIPHAHQWPDLEKIHTTMEAAGYNVFVIFTIRDFHASAKSVVRRGYDKKNGLEHCYKNQFEMIIRLGNYLDNAVFPERFVYSTYEAFTTSVGFRRWLFDRIGMPYPENFSVDNRNQKYYGGS